MQSSSKATGRDKREAGTARPSGIAKEVRGIVVLEGHEVCEPV